MTHKATKLAIGGLIFACALGYLAYAGMQKGWVYTLNVDSYLADAKYATERVRLNGIVQEKDLVIQKSSMQARFVIKGDTAELTVAYRGVIPDMLKPGVEALVEGKRDASGVFQADSLMTKCASKYEEKPKDHPAPTPAAGG